MSVKSRSFCLATAPKKRIAKAERKHAAKKAGYEKRYYFATDTLSYVVTKFSWWCWDPASCPGTGRHCSECHALICSECGCPCQLVSSKL